MAKATVRCLDGSLVPVETLSIPVPRADGSAAVLVVLRDISERTRAAERLVRSENQVRNILNTAMDGIISMDSQQNIVLFNAAAEAIFGWSAEQVLGRQIDCLIPDRFRSQHRDQVEQFGRGAVQNRRMGPQRTIAALRASGEEFQIEASISKTSADGGTLFTVILRDVTEAVLYRRQIEQQSQVLDQVSDAVSVHDLQDRITYWNAAAQCLFGWSAEEILGKNGEGARVDGRRLCCAAHGGVLYCHIRHAEPEGAGLACLGCRLPIGCERDVGSGRGTWAGLQRGG